MGQDIKAEPLYALLRASLQLQQHIDYCGRGHAEVRTTAATSGALVKLIDGWCVDHAASLVPTFFEDNDDASKLGEDAFLARLRGWLETSVEIGMDNDQRGGRDQRNQNLLDQDLPAQGFRILVVTVDEAEQCLFREYADVWGWHVDIASQPAAAKELMRQTAYDAILACADKVDPSGLRLVEIISPVSQDIPIMLLIDGPNETDLAVACLAGVDSVQFRPLLLSTFRLAVSDIVEVRRAERMDTELSALD